MVTTQQAIFRIILGLSWIALFLLIILALPN